MTRKCIRVIGKVQGVFFRMYTKKKALSLGLAGWVSNEDDGSVSIVVEGEESKVEELISWCHHGSPWAKVLKVEDREEKYSGEEKGFSIK